MKGAVMNTKVHSHLQGWFGSGGEALIVSEP